MLDSSLAGDQEKNVCVEIVKKNLFYRLRLKHSELLEGLHSSQSTPHLGKSSFRIAKCAKRLAGATDTKGDLPEFKNSSDLGCRLCEGRC